MVPEIDARGLLCPLPVLRLRKVLEGLPPGTEVALLATDAMARIDVPHFCAAAGHMLLATEEPEPGTLRLRVRKGEGPGREPPRPRS